MSEPQSVRGYVIGKMPFGNISFIVRALTHPRLATRLLGPHVGEEWNEK